MIDVVRRVAETIFIPFSVGGGIRTVEDMRQVILAGAEKVSVNTEAVQNPAHHRRGGAGLRQPVHRPRHGREEKSAETAKIPSGYEMVIHGGRTATGIDALWWAQEAERLGAGEICLNSIDADGTQDGYEIDLTALISSQRPDSRDRLRRRREARASPRCPHPGTGRRRPDRLDGPLPDLYHPGDQDVSP